MKSMGKLALAAAGLAVAVFAALGMLSPAFAVADEEAPGARGIVIGLGEAAPRSDGGTEFDVVRWVEDGIEVTPVPDVRVFADVAE
ncbi:hypothetical protein [Collinsella sp. D33t1_170424_A12]|uniref:hypothetical protein n=1 Tax=Collinsella sp. D33t1_170424_A12 TaxID=2787135 RepID=UPI001897A3DB|nr:hypothetical protein [Collinsella sp. D33t1_170424_A12]